MILVTGGAGFIGSNLVAGLNDRGESNIVICDQLGNDDKWNNLRKHSFTDFLSPENLFSWLNSYSSEIEVVFHLGASSSTTEKDADKVLNNNFSLSLDLWRWCSSNNSRLIYASSAATYGAGSDGFCDNPEQLPMLRPLNLYGWSKHIFDVNALRLANLNQHPRQWVGLKFFNAYGPNEYHKGSQQSVISQFYRQIVAEGKAYAFKSYHPNYEHGGQMRDFIWIGDCVDVLIWAYEHINVTGIFNCGTGVARSFSDVLSSCFSAAQCPEAVKFIDCPTQIRSKYQYFTEANMTRLQNAGYNKSFTKLEVGITRYVCEFLATDDPYL